MPNTRTILVVDDEETIRRVVTMTLSRVGYEEVLEAEDATQALEISEVHERPTFYFPISSCRVNWMDAAWQERWLKPDRKPRSS